MKYTIEAACGCHSGKIRKNNEDNFWFDGKYLELNNHGLISPLYLKRMLKHDLYIELIYLEKKD